MGKMGILCAICDTLCEPDEMMQLDGVGLVCASCFLGQLMEIDD